MNFQQLVLIVFFAEFFIIIIVFTVVFSDILVKIMLWLLTGNLDSLSVPFLCLR